MPIIFNDKRVQVELGHGDVRIAHGLVDDWAAVLFFPSEVTPVGTKFDLDTPLEVAAEDTPVRIIFDKERSIDVLIGALLDAKRMMVHKRAESVTPMEKPEEK
jgi:hypothetical protein